MAQSSAIQVTSELALTHMQCHGLLHKVIYHPSTWQLFECLWFKKKFAAPKVDETQGRQAKRKSLLTTDGGRWVIQGE